MAIFSFYVINFFIVYWKFLLPILLLAPCMILAIPSITFFIESFTLICCNLWLKNICTRRPYFVIGHLAYHTWQWLDFVLKFVEQCSFVMPIPINKCHTAGSFFSIIFFSCFYKFFLVYSILNFYLCCYLRVWLIWVVYYFTCSEINN